MPRALIVDDHPQVRAMISLALQSKGFDVVVAENGEAGISEFCKSSFDLAIVDIYMPKLDGAKMIKALRAQKPNFPIIAMSGVMLKSSGRTALDLFPMSRAFSNVICLQKPFRPAELFESIEKAIEVAADGMAEQ